MALNADVHRRFYRRLTAPLPQDDERRTVWTVDSSFLFDASGYDQPGRFFVLNTTDVKHTGYLYRADTDGEEGCQENSRHHWAYSSTGLADSFTPRDGSPAIEILSSCEPLANTCDMLDLFVASTTNGLSLYYRTEQGGDDMQRQSTWFSAQARFVLETCP